MKKIKILLIVIIMSASFSSCNLLGDLEGDQGEDFLEKYNGVTWANDDPQVGYLRINDNVNKYLESWWFYEDCYVYDNNFEINFIDIYDNKLIYIIDEGTSYQETLTFTVKDGVLKLIVESDSGNEILYFDKTSVDINTLEICK